MVAKKNLGVLILAGGKGTRMYSSLPKPLHAVCGEPILSHILKKAQKLKAEGLCVLVGHQADLLKKTVQDNLSNWGIKTPVDFALQTELTGSGTAVKSAIDFIRKFKNILILAGDAPLIEADTLSAMNKSHNKSGAACTVFTISLDNPKGYGRIVRDAEGDFVKITEESETDAKTALIKEVNSGMYIFDTAKLEAMLKLLKPQGPKKEYYLTDVLGFLKSKGDKVAVYQAADYTEAMGINSKRQLAEASAIMCAKTNNKLMDAGVTMINPQAAYIGADVKIGADTIIYPDVFISGKTVIGKDCFIGPGCWIENSTIKDGATIKSGCYIVDSRIDALCQVGPYAHLRPATVLKEGAKVGNYVEIKKSTIGKGSKVPHLTYIGDCEMGSKVNVGAGSITCNYDGVNKHKTIIKDNVFVGSNTNFVAPVTIGAGARIGAGSTITQDIPAGDLAIARARQVNLKNKKRVSKNDL